MLLVLVLSSAARARAGNKNQYSGSGWEFHVFLAARDASDKWHGVDPWWSSPGVLPMSEMLKVHALEGIVGVDVSSPEQPFPLRVC